jgi:hypothetical protein
MKLAFGLELSGNTGLSFGFFLAGSVLEQVALAFCSGKRIFNAASGIALVRILFCLAVILSFERFRTLDFALTILGLSPLLTSIPSYFILYRSGRSDHLEKSHLPH